MSLNEKLELDLAWRKTKFSSKDRLFVDKPHIVDLLAKNEEEWLSKVRDSFDEDYNFNYSRVVDLPKQEYHVRPASVLDINDSLLYSALVLELYEDIHQSISWSAGKYRFSHILKEDKEGKKWLEYYLDYWENWNNISRRLIEEDYNYVLFSDIAGFYENISIKRLISDLRDISDKNEVIDQLNDALQIWALPRNTGLPQGYHPSDVLAELYHNSIDKRMKNNGYRFARYNDDLRIFTKTEEEAKIALKKLTNLYREKGLNLHSAKTCILQKEEAIEKIDEVDNNIKQIQKAQEVKDINWDGEWQRVIDYGTEEDENEKETENDDRPDKELIEDAFKRFYLTNEEEGNKHLFRFLISNMGYHESEIGIDYCISHIEKGGSDISKILDNYFAELEEDLGIADRLAEILRDDNLIYPYQKFYIIKWFYEQERVNEKTLSAVRTQLDEGLNQDAKNYAIAYLGDYGDASDLDVVQKMYREEGNSLTKAIIVISLRRMEKSRRNSFYSRVKGDNKFVTLAVDRAKNMTD